MINIYQKPHLYSIFKPAHMPAAAYNLVFCVGHFRNLLQISVETTCCNLGDSLLQIFNRLRLQNVIVLVRGMM